MLSLALSGSALTRFGQTHWQSAREMKANGFFGAPGTGFILGKLGPPGSRANYICSKVFPHALIVAPTGRGKTTGFVIPNLLTWQGSAVTLDVKGECFEATARHRAAQGDKVYRFAPTDWEGKRTHRYNPLLRIYQLKDPARQQMELQLLATLFLQSDNDRVQGLLKGGIDLFVAAGLLAFQRKRPTLGEIYRIAASGGNKQKEYFARGHEVDNRAAKLIFTRLASTNNDTLTSYVSLLMTSGLDQWQNPAIDEATAVSDFDFRTIRKKPFSVYLVVQPLMVKPLAPLIRLFFSDLLSAMQEKDPGPDEPWPVMIMLDEFNRLGKMPIVVESIETLRTYRGHLAVVTQTIPALDEIYGENTRRTEESSLLPEDEARRLPLDEIVMVIDAQMPVRAKRIQYFDDWLFKAIHAAQTGELPFPEPGGGGSQGNLPLSMRAMPMAPPPDGPSGPEADAEAALQAADGQSSGQTDVIPKKTAPAVQAVIAEEQRQMEMDFGGQVADAETVGVDDEAQMRSAVDGLEDMEAMLQEEGGKKPIHR